MAAGAGGGVGTGRAVLDVGGVASSAARRSRSFAGCACFGGVGSGSLFAAAGFWGAAAVFGAAAGRAPATPRSTTSPEPASTLRGSVSASASPL